MWVCVRYSRLCCCDCAVPGVLQAFLSLSLRTHMHSVADVRLCTAVVCRSPWCSCMDALVLLTVFWFGAIHVVIHRFVQDEV